MSGPKQVGSREDEPVGFEFVQFDLGMKRMLLPRGLAGEVREDIERRAVAEHEQRAEEARLRLEEQKASRASASAPEPDDIAPSWEAEAQRGWHRVLPKLGAMLAQASNDSEVGRSADKDVNERRGRLLARLKKLGPDRRVAHPADWRQAVNELDAAQPHFREPTRLLRNALSLAEATGRPVRVPPMLLLGPPGVGKTHYSQCVARLLGAPHATIDFGQPSAGNHLLGSDKVWGNSQTGLLLNLLALGECANPVVLLDELDKSSVFSSSRNGDALGQLHGVLEPLTARQAVDLSVDIEFDASLVTYLATANSLVGIGATIVSRLEVLVIEPPTVEQAMVIARSVVQGVLARVGLLERVVFERQAVALLAHLSPRLMVRTVEKALAAAVTDGRERVSEAGLWEELQGPAQRSRHH